MNSTLLQPAVSAVRRRAFTVVELLVAVSVLTLIVVVLFGLFDQVQKALRSNVAQVDVLEGGRAAMDLMGRELEQMDAGNLLSNQNLFVGMTATPYQLALLDPGEYHTNVLDQLFFLSRFNKTWTGTGYRVLYYGPDGVADQFAAQLGAPQVGTLGRFHLEVSAPDLAKTNLMLRILGNNALNPPTNNLAQFQRVLDGVVHFRMRAYDTNGMLMVSNIYPNVRIFTNATQSPEYVFTNSALPAAVEIELGVLEPHVLERYKSFSSPSAASNYLARQVAAVHLFQQRIPIRTAQ